MERDIQTKIMCITFVAKDPFFSVNPAQICAYRFLFFLCRYAGFRRTIVLDRREIVELLDLLQDGKLSWDQFSTAVKEVHKNRMGQPTLRKVIPGRPKEEDYFYANPQECTGPSRISSIQSREFDI